MRMKTCLMLAITLFLLCATAMAQNEAPKAEIFGGLSYLRTSGNTNVLGWTGQGAFNLNKWFGVAGDFAGHYQTRSEEISRPSANVHTFMFGPQISDRAGRVTGFAHALFGAARIREGFRLGQGTAATTGTHFAMAFGGGIDANLTNVIAVRIVQADYEGFRVGNLAGNESIRNNFRLSIGVVFKVK